ncbi:hypothetical protein [Taibaiella koreensis]|uniref:hypothetical protein n=1 Tax=Taibaiella koreensis TaxID=1268548 RepID=UPI000E59B3D2|nr:hypothetical protein [Taibaiella koreensis]
MEASFIDVLTGSFKFSDVVAEREKEFSLLHIGDHLHEIKLTRAEAKLFREGFQDGIADLESSAIGTDNIIRSEILEWFLTLPAEYDYLFRKNKLTIRNANILRMDQFIDCRRANYDRSKIRDENVYVLAIPNKIVKVDLVFHNCRFWGGVNVSNASFRNLEFSLCSFGTGQIERDFFNQNIRMYPSVYADQASFDGNLIFAGEEEGDTFKSIGSFDCKADLVFTNCIIKNHLKIHNFGTDHDVDLSFAQIEQVNIWHLNIYNATLKLLFASVKNVYLQGSFFLAPQGVETSAIDCTGLQSDYLYIRNHCIVIGLTILGNTGTRQTVDLTTSLFVSSEKANLCSADDLFDNKDTSIDFSNASMAHLKLSEAAISIGTIVGKNIKAGNIDFSRSKFLNYDKGIFRKAFIMRGAHIENAISFNTLDIGDVGWWNAEQNKPNWYSLSGIINNYLNDRLVPATQQANDRQKRNEAMLKYIFEESGLRAKIGEIEEMEEAESNVPAFLYQSIVNEIYDEKKVRAGTCDENIDKSECHKICRRYTLVVGEADFSSVSVNSKVDFAGGFFYGMDHQRSDDEYHCALNLKSLKLDGDLFLNDCNNSTLIPRFKAYGMVDLHSARVNQFFITPKCGIDQDTRWRIIGLKYEYIYSSVGKDGRRQLEKCEWFEDFIEEENHRQPYEQLAKAFYKAGEDTRAKRTLILERIRTSEIYSERLLFRSFTIFAKPAWKTAQVLLIIMLIGALAFLLAGNGTGIFEAMLYSIENMLPISFREDDVFKAGADKIEIFGIPLIATKTFVVVHKILGTLYLAIFVIGIARITKKDID